MPALAGVDLDVPAGSFVAVLGPSGCGKTTLLRIIAGFTNPDHGTIVLGGKTIVGPSASVSPQRRRIGYVPQEGALFPHLDVAANIAFGLPRAQRRAGRRVAELLELVDLDRSLGGRYPHQLSGGQQQRVALARALAPAPSVVLLDEPFSSLDTALRLSTARAVVQALRAAKATAVLVTHDQNEALSLADQIAVMNAGRIEQVGTPQSVYQSPANASVGAFVGTAVLFPATVTGMTATCALGVVDVPAGSIQGPAEVLIRPEQIDVLPRSASDGQPARVTDVAYFGHDATVHLLLESDATPVTARVLGTQTPETGSQVRVKVAGLATPYPSGKAGSGDLLAV